MDADTRMLIRELRAVGSHKAADLLLERYPSGGRHSGIAIVVIGHLSWTAQDQVRLAEHYLSRIPFASGHPYDVFAKIMPITKLVGIINKFIPESDEDRRLLRYYIGPVLAMRSRTDDDRDAVAELMAKI